MNEPTNRELANQISGLDNKISSVLDALIGFKDAVIKKFDESKEYAENTRELIVDFRKDMDGALQIVTGKSNDHDQKIQQHDHSITQIQSDIVVLKTKAFPE